VVLIAISTTEHENIMSHNEEIVLFTLRQILRQAQDRAQGKR